MIVKKIIILVCILLAIIVTSSVERGIFPVKQDFKIVSYNIHSGLNKDMYPTLFDIIDFLRISNADVICLQEVNESAKLGFQVSSLKEELNMYSHFGANVVNFGSNYGMATYSRYPIKSENHIYLHSDREQRGILHTVIKVGSKKLNIVNVHLGLGKEEREIQLKELVQFVEGLGEEPFIVVGDFNEGNIQMDNNLMKDVALELNRSNILTFATGLDRIDYIFVSPNIEVLDYEVLIKSMSDHYPIIARLRI